MALHGLYYVSTPPGPTPLIENAGNVMTTMSYSRILNSFGFPPSFVDEQIIIGVYDASMDISAPGPSSVGGQIFSPAPFAPNVYAAGPPLLITGPVIVSFLNSFLTTGPATFSNVDAVTIDIPATAGPLVLPQIAPIVVPISGGGAEVYYNAWVAPDGTLWEHSIYDTGGPGFLSGPFAFMAGPQL